jgi:hypothetical protein
MAYGSISRSRSKPGQSRHLVAQTHSLLAIHQDRSDPLSIERDVLVGRNLFDMSRWQDNLINEPEGHATPFRMATSTK